MESLKPHVCIFFFFSAKKDEKDEKNLKRRVKVWKWPNSILTRFQVHTAHESWSKYAQHSNQVSYSLKKELSNLDFLISFCVL